MEFHNTPHCTRLRWLVRPWTTCWACSWRTSGPDAWAVRSIQSCTQYIQAGRALFLMQDLPNCPSSPGPSADQVRLSLPVDAFSRQHSRARHHHRQQHHPHHHFHLLSSSTASSPTYSFPFLSSATAGFLLGTGVRCLLVRTTYFVCDFVSWHVVVYLYSIPPLGKSPYFKFLTHK